MFLLSPGWTYLSFCCPGLRKTGTASTGLGCLLGLRLLGDTPGIVPHARSQPDFFYSTLGLYHSDPSLGCLLRCGLAPYASCSGSSASSLAILCLTHSPGLWKHIFCPCRVSMMMMGWPLLVPQAFALFEMPRFHSFPTGLAFIGIAPLTLPSLFWTPITLYDFRLHQLGHRRIWTVPEWFCHSQGSYSVLRLFNP